VTTAEQTAGGSQFTFAEGRGEIVACVIANHAIPGYDAKCGYKVSIQQLDANWQPTTDEPIDEFLACGPVTKFHPGLAENSDDNSAELEFGAAGDAGDADGAEGTCLLSLTGAGPDKKSKAIIFVNSLIAVGIKPALLNGYAPNLVGLKANFTQMMLEKGADYKGKNDPTALIVGVMGKQAGAVINQWPEGQGATVTAAVAAAPVAAARPTPRPRVVKPVAAVVAAPVAAVAVAPVAVAAAVAAVPAGAVDEVIEGVALTVLVAVADSSAGQTLTRQKIASKLVTIMAKTRVPTVQHKPVQALVASDWFIERAAEFGWDVVGDSVSFPSAEAAA